MSSKQKFIAILTKTMIRVKPKQNRQLIVLIDLDGVLLDFEEQFLNKFQAIYPDEPFIPCEDRNSFDPAVQYATLPNAAENIVDLVQSIYGGKHFFRDAPEVEGAVQAIQEMAEIEGVDVYIVSTPTFNVGGFKISGPQKYDWVKNHLGKSWLKKLILTNDKTVVKGHLLIDDQVDIKGALQKPSWEHIVFSACHNRNVDIGGRTRLENWTNGEWRKILEDCRMRM